MADENGKQIELRMGSAVATEDTGQGDHFDPGASAGSAGPGAGFNPHAAGPGMAEGPKPVMGWIAVGAGLLAIFFNGVVFVPIAIVCSIIALFMGQGMWAFLGLLTAFAGLLTSPVLLAILGLGALAAWFGIPVP